MIYHIYRIKDKNLIIEIHAEKALHKYTTSFHDKNAQQMDIKGTYLIIIKILYEKPTVNIICNDERLKAFYLTSETRQRYPLSQFSILANTGGPS